MRRIALIALGEQEARLAMRVQGALPSVTLYVHEKVTAAPQARRFSRIMGLTREVFARHEGLVFFAPCGVVVRAIAPHIKHKLRDPAVVVVDAGARFAISLLCGHEGGANDLAIRIGNCLDAEPVISTTTEAEKHYTMGIGCRRGVSAAEIRAAIETACAKARILPAQLRILASVDLKSGEAGLLAAAAQLSIPLRFIGADRIRACTEKFARSSFVQRKVNLPAVAEPCALLAGRRTSFVLPKTIIGPVTIAIARENSWWWESAPAAKSTARSAARRPSAKRKSSRATRPTSS